MERDQLIAAARAGDTDALSALLKECQPDLRRYAQSKCASKDVDDAVQDALWILHEQYKALKHAAALSGWLFKIIKGICFRMGYRERNLTTLEEDVAEGQTSHPEDLRLDLERALAALEPQHLEVLLLRDMYGYSAEEAATRLQISAEAVKSRLHRARTNVRQALGRGE
ncbi:RNA polymerase sigma factor (sigma-70 family) [Granulicella aggregans]|uniref:RNA polymerase sigma factor (Sigma-70 family) n=1 Tax=Granulicella aggregans TaxID=474949 RepID=A0A7W7ZDT3_9BACT|nr:RNA polymerase sigma factor (sigma-70 family) [Granulicella aggregans]